MDGMIATLSQATPFLAGGFVINLLISAVSMTLGTVLGFALATLRAARSRAATLPAQALTNLCRNVPSFVLLFYVAFLLPVEAEIGGTLVFIPLWIKAAVALTIPVIGFTSDQGAGFYRHRRAGDGHAAATFWTAWVQYLLIIVMASATASVIGADEIVGRANRIITLDTGPAFLLVTYGYVSLWFLATGLILSWVAGRLTPRTT